MGLEGPRTAESTANRRFERPPSKKSPKKAHGVLHKIGMLCNPNLAIFYDNLIRKLVNLKVIKPFFFEGLFSFK